MVCNIDVVIAGSIAVSLRGLGCVQARGDETRPNESPRRETVDPFDGVPNRDREGVDEGGGHDVRAQREGA